MFNFAAPANCGEVSVPTRSREGRKRKNNKNKKNKRKQIKETKSDETNERIVNFKKEISEFFNRNAFYDGRFTQEILPQLH